MSVLAIVGIIVLASAGVIVFGALGLWLWILSMKNWN